MASADAIFISYRRDGGTEHVRTFQEFLEGQGYDVFLDVDGLTSGHFNKQLLGEIERRSHFVLICSAGCLDRCREEGDWIRAEVAHAIQLNRNIVPIVIPGFVWPKAEALPPEIRELSANNAFLYSFAHWKSIRSELARRFPRGRTEAESPAWRFVRTFLPQIRKLGAIPAADRGSKNPLLLDAAKNFLECARPSEAREVIERSPARVVGSARHAIRKRCKCLAPCLRSRSSRSCRIVISHSRSQKCCDRTFDFSLDSIWTAQATLSYRASVRE